MLGGVGWACKVAVTVDERSLRMGDHKLVCNFHSHEFMDSERPYPPSEVTRLGLPLYEGAKEYATAYGDLIAIDATGAEKAYYDGFTNAWFPLR